MNTITTTLHPHHQSAYEYSLEDSNEVAKSGWWGSDKQRVARLT